MDYYTPLFSKIVESSLWDEPDFVVKVFLTMLAVKDKDWVVRRNAYNLAFLSRKSEEEVIKALDVLESPDTRRKEAQEHEGRRIKKVDGGWLIINGPYYQKVMQDINGRLRNAERQKRYRNNHLTGEDATVRAEDSGATPEQVDRMKTSFLPEKCQ